MRLQTYKLRSGLTTALHREGSIAGLLLSCQDVDIACIIGAHVLWLGCCCPHCRQPHPAATASSVERQMPPGPLRCWPSVKVAAVCRRGHQAALMV